MLLHTHEQLTKLARSRTAFCIADRIDDSIRLAVLDLFPTSEDGGPPNLWYLSRINVPEPFRNCGHGSEMMRRLESIADECGMVVLVHPTRNYGAELARLRAFFERFGFFHYLDFGGLGEYTRYPKC